MRVQLKADSLELSLGVSLPHLGVSSVMTHGLSTMCSRKMLSKASGFLQATVKAGSCQQQFNSLNAEYATMKQGLANLGLTGKTVDEKKNPGTITEGSLLAHILEAMKLYELRMLPCWTGPGVGRGGGVGHVCSLGSSV